MKTLQHYLQDRISAIHNKYGCFYAFSNEQFAKKKKDGVNYCSISGGLIVPNEHASIVISLTNEAVHNAIQEDIAENGKTAIIKRELFNHEAIYTYSIEDTVDSLSGYNVSNEEVQAVFNQIINEEV